MTTGRPGADRSLIQVTDSGIHRETPLDQQPEDAAFFFRDGETYQMTLGSNELIQVNAASRARSDIERVDRALELLVELTGNTKLLEFSLL